MAPYAFTTDTREGRFTVRVPGWFPVVDEFDLYAWGHLEQRAGRGCLVCDPPFADLVLIDGEELTDDKAIRVLAAQQWFARHRRNVHGA